MSAPMVIAALATFPTAGALLVMTNRAWHWLRPTGQHRDPGLVALADRIALGDLDANDTAWCPACARTTFHALHTDQTRTCWTCNTTTREDR